jgi:deoxyribonuclease-4
MPTAGGLHHSLLAGHKIGCTVVQLFSGSPRQWHHPPLSTAAIDAFLAAREETGIRSTVAHDSYLINLAAPDPFVLERSQHAFRGELERAHLLGIPWVVTHMGAHLDQGEAEAVARLIENLKRILDETDQDGITAGVALETTAGQGTGLGWRFEQLGEILQGVGEHPRLGVCLDTCHVFAAGYDLRSPEVYAATLDAFDSTVGLDHLKVIHANDSKKPLGSRLDRHEHIGQGEIGIEAFGRLVTDPRLLRVPIVIETPESETMHAVNLKRLQQLAAGAEASMRISVQFFGHYTDLVGGETLEVTLPVGASVLDLTVALAEHNPRLSGLASHCRFALDDEYTTLDAVVHAGCTVVVLPPMSGG